MRKFRFRVTGSLLLILAAFFLIAAGISRYLETDSGNILIHDIDIESYEGFLYGNLECLVYVFRFNNPATSGGGWAKS